MSAGSSSPVRSDPAAYSTYVDASTPAAVVSGLPARVLSWGVVHLLVRRQRFTCVRDWETTPRDWVEGYSHVRYHALMRDRVRMEAYAAAIERAVAGKLVLEIGTGAFAPLARMAAAAGARKVYAMEANSRSVASARRLIRQRGLEGRIEVLEGFSADLTLPERAQVLIHDVVGYLGSDEGMAGIVHDAKARLLVDDAVHIPSRCTVRVAPVHIRDPHKGSFLARAFQRWFFDAAKPSALSQIWNFPQENILAEPEIYEDREFARPFALQEERSIPFTVSSRGSFTGFLFWMELATDADHTIRTLRGTTWGAAYLEVCPQSFELLPGDRILLETFQDLTVSPRYSFRTALERDARSQDLGTQRIRWT